MVHDGVGRCYAAIFDGHNGAGAADTAGVQHHWAGGGCLVSRSGPGGGGQLHASAGAGMAWDVPGEFWQGAGWVTV
jgi:hypothetical protein